VGAQLGAQRLIAPKSKCPAHRFKIPWAVGAGHPEWALDNLGSVSSWHFFCAVHRRQPDPKVFRKRKKEKEEEKRERQKRIMASGWHFISVIDASLTQPKVSADGECGLALLSVVDMV